MRKILLILSLLFALDSIGQFPVIVNGWRHNISSCADSDANDFIAAAGITDATQKTAICNLVIDLKDAGLWTSFSAIYPMVGGTATTHKYNLKDPDDDDASYRLTFAGTSTHSSNGVAWNGSTGYANTHLSPTAFGIDDIHLSYYSRTNNTTNATDMGCHNTGVSLTRILLYTSGSNFSSLNDFVFPTFAVTNTAIYEISSRENSTDFQTYQNGNVVARSAAAPSSTIPNYTIYIGALNNANTAAEFSDRQCAFATIGTGLNSEEAAALNIIVETFQDALSRGVQ